MVNLYKTNRKKNKNSDSNSLVKQKDNAVRK